MRPQELVDLLDQRAGKVHRRDGVVLRTLAEILTRYDELNAPPAKNPQPRP